MYFFEEESKENGNFLKWLQEVKYKMNVPQNKTKIITKMEMLITL